MGLKGPADTQLGKTVLAPAVGCSGLLNEAACAAGSCNGAGFWLGLG